MICEKRGGMVCERAFFGLYLGAEIVRTVQTDWLENEFLPEKRALRKCFSYEA